MHPSPETDVMESNEVQPSPKTTSCEMAYTKSVSSPKPSMLMAVPRKTSNTSPVASSNTARLVMAVGESLKWEKLTISGPKSVQNVVVAGLLRDKCPPSQGNTLVVPGLNACITKAWSNTSPPSGTLDKPSGPANSPALDSLIVSVVPGDTRSTKGDIWGWVTPKLPYNTASTNPPNVGEDPSSNAVAGEAASTTATTLFCQLFPSIKEKPSSSNDMPPKSTTACVSGTKTSWLTNVDFTNTKLWPSKLVPGSP